MKSLFKDVSKKFNSLSTCQITLGVVAILVIGYYGYQYLKNSGVLLGMKLGEGNGNGNGNGRAYMNVNRNNKEHFDNSEKSDEYYGNSNDAVLVTFYAFDYCGFCKKFDPVWKEAQTKDYPLKVKFRYVVANKLSPQEKSSIAYYVESKYAPNVILTHRGKNIKEFDQQMNKPLKGLDEFISTKGQVNSNSNSKHL